MKPISPLTNEELIVHTASMLDMAEDEFANHGCNDHELPATQENLEFVRDMIAASDYPEDNPHLSVMGRRSMSWIGK